MKDSRASSPRALALVLAADDSTRRIWTISSAVAMARRVARGRKVLLADLECRKPSALAALIGEPEVTPGIVDVLFRRASFPSIARRPPSQPFIFLPCGNDPPPLAEVYSHPGWAQIARRLQGKNAVFLACVSADDWAELGPIPGFEACIVLNGTDGQVRLPEGARKIVEVAAPPEVRSRHRDEASLPDYAVPAALGIAAEPGPGLASRTAKARESDETAPGLGPPVAWSSEFAADPTTAPLTQLRTLASRRRVLEDSRSRRRRKRMAYAALVAVCSLALGATGWLVWGGGGCIDLLNAERAGLADGQAAVATRWGEASSCVVAELTSLLRRIGTESAGAITLARTGPGTEGRDARGESGDSSPLCGDASRRGSGRSQPTDAGCEVEPPRREMELALPYAVVVGEFADLDEARRRLEESEAAPAPVYLVPTQLAGAVRYRVFAGLLTDNLQAEALLSRLVHSGIMDNPTTSDIKHVPYAFSFGIFRGEEDLFVLETLVAHDVPAYLVPADGAGEGKEQVYRVYAGAFESSDESLPLRDSIMRAGLTAELVERTGLVTR